MCFGGGDDGSSKKIIKMQKEEAKKAEAREAKRQADIKQGLANVKGIFHGKPVMKDVAQTFKASDFSKAKAGAGVSGLPAGYTYVQVDGTPVAQTVSSNNSRNTGRLGGNTRESGNNNSFNSGGSGGDHGPQGGMAQQSNNNYNATPQEWAIKGPDGKIYKKGANIGFSTQQDTGEVTGDWQEAFLKDFKDKILNYFNPQVAEQYGKAANETSHRLADAGLSESTAGIMAAADLEKQRKIREGEVANKADTDAGNMADRIKREEDAATNLVYSTENPGVAAGSATRGVQNLTAESPALTPLEAIFEVASIGGANLYKGLSNAKSVGGFNSSSSTGRNQTTVG